MINFFKRSENILGKIILSFTCLIIGILPLKMLIWEHLIPGRENGEPLVILGNFGLIIILIIGPHIYKKLNDNKVKSDE